MGGTPAIHLPYSTADQEIQEICHSSLHKQALQNCTHRLCPCTRLWGEGKLVQEIAHININNTIYNIISSVQIGTVLSKARVAVF